MLEFFDLMMKPFLVCLILTGIHAYLGFHVIERGVIFVDLALAQIAAFGATVGFLLGYGLHSQGGYLISLGFTLVGALLFTMSRHQKQLFPQEALIGVFYAIAAAACILVLSYSPDGGEELKSVMVGHLLFVNWSEIFKIFILYSILGILHFLIRKPLFLVSTNPDLAFQKKMKIWVWDLLFYGSFGLVVTSSTEIAGVLLVFSYLIVPSICGILLANSFKNRLLVGWLCGLITSIIGIIVSYQVDLPTGATIVCSFGLSLLACYFIRFYKSFN